MCLTMRCSGLAARTFASWKARGTNRLTLPIGNRWRRRALPGPLDLRVALVRRVVLVEPGRPGLKVLKVPQVLKEPLARKGRLGPPDRKGQKAQPERKAPPALKVK